MRLRRAIQWKQGLRHKFVRRRLFSSLRGPVDPLRILFCGSDDFSAASLRRLHNEHVQDSTFIASLDVLCKQGKLSGRGLKTIRDGKASFSSSDLLLQS